MNQSFFINLLSRILLIILVAIGIGWAAFGLQQWLLSALLTLLLAGLVINLLHYQNRVNERINYFFEAIKNEDSSLAFPTHKNDKIIQKLSQNLTKVNEQIQRIKIQHHQQEQYFRALIEHVGTGILTYDERGFVIHANSAVKKLLGLEQFTHLKQLTKVDEQLAQTLPQVQQVGQKLITFNGKQGKVTISIKANSFINNDQALTLLSVQDINNELDEKELDSWMRLIRVLTHEIMNSIAPVTSLSESLSHFFRKNGHTISPEEVDEKMINTTIRGLDVIKEQGRGLIAFVESYRKLTRLPKPDKKPNRVLNLLEKMVLLNKAQHPESSIQFKLNVESPDLMIHADEKMISQVLLNLIKNSREALVETPNACIELMAGRNKNGQVEVCVKDNGPGIPNELLDEIFVPFFTTRENGNGIGLSLSRQILRLHNGSLRVRSVPHKETLFCMLFNE
ncbi:ATP-binding protein [uncultured Sunxiuqinia sp.]|uniref:sensor histidine kinase n=1 Tax=uncultured Sunxiuqinia sp. TaxID=1573825 RepID=UPI0026177771|nr:ATP-binding protein [uncultured Sunxiuqinia sp.]